MFIKFQGNTSKTPGQHFLQSVWQCAAMFTIAVFLGFSINQFRDNRLPLFNNWSMESSLLSLSGDRMDISLFEAKSLYLNKSAIFIDARPTDDYERGHIRGARSLPWHEIDQRFVEVTKGISVNTPIITYCDGKTCRLSHDLANFLLDMGFTNVSILVNGWTKWQDADLPVDKEGSN